MAEAVTTDHRHIVRLRHIMGRLAVEGIDRGVRSAQVERGRP